MDRKESFIQFIKFGIVGLSNTIIAYVLNILTLLILRPFVLNWDYVIANIVAFVLSVLWSFYWNNKYVFTVKEGEKRSTLHTLLKTYASYGFTGIVLNNALSYVWINLLFISKYIAPLINLIVSVPVNFVMNKMWAFRS